VSKATPKSKALITLQKLVRVSAADDNGYCKCVSCGQYEHWKDMDGGHFIPKGNSSFWALKKMNVHPQCKKCNGFEMKFGTAQVSYTLWMERTYGAGKVAYMISCKRNPIKYYKADLVEMTAQWNNEIKEHLDRISEG